MERTDTKEFTAVRDGLTIRGRIFGGDGPVIIMSHGFLADQRACEAYALAAAGWGYTAVSYDFCGGGPNSSSDGLSEDMTVLTEVRDLEAVIGYVKSSFPGREIMLMGQSQGGFVSALTAAKRDDISSLILLYPALCIPDDSMKGDMLIYRFDPKNIPDIIGEMPMRLGGEYARCMQGFDWEGAISLYVGRVLLIHGTADNIVSISYSKRASELYENASLKEIRGASHGFEGADLEYVLGLIREFLES